MGHFLAQDWAALELWLILFVTYWSLCLLASLEVGNLLQISDPQASPSPACLRPHAVPLPHGSLWGGSSKNVLCSLIVSHPRIKAKAARLVWETVFINRTLIQLPSEEFDH